MREDYQEFVNRNAEIVILGPEGPEDFKKYWLNENLPFIGLPDPEHTVLKLYGQEVKLFKLGRMPAQFIVDREGKVRFAHYSGSMTDIPTNDELLKTLDLIDRE